MTLIEFLTARLDEWEHALRDEEEMFGSRLLIRILRDDIAAKRAIVAMHTGGHECPSAEDNCGWWIDENDPCPTLRIMASVYSDHPDYDPGWKP